MSDTHTSDAMTNPGQQLIALLNARDYAAASALYAPNATYQSPGLVSEEHGRPDGRLHGRSAIIDYFREAIGESDFRLTPVDQFAGVKLIVAISTNGDRTFIDVLGMDSGGLITEHIEVTPKPSTNY